MGIKGKFQGGFTKVVAFFAGVVGVYAILFATGFLLYFQYSLAVASSILSLHYQTDKIYFWTQTSVTPRYSVHFQDFFKTYPLILEHCSL